MQGQRIGYVRVSTVDQNPERQLEQVPVDRVYTDTGLDQGIGHFMLCEVDSAARAPTPRIPVLPQTSSAASDQKSVPLPSSRQAG